MRDSTQVQFKKTSLSGGTRVVTENHSNSQAVAIGVFIETGTRDETRDLQGISHFLEHLVFKGTKERNSFEIASSMESVGGELNAYTTREYTCFHTLSLHQNWDLAVDVLIDLVSGALFEKEELEKERQVILQEIGMAADSLEEFAFDLFFEEAYKGKSMGYPILGTEASIGDMKRKDILAYYKGTYGGKNLIISAAGCIDHDLFAKHVEKRLKKNRHEQKRWSRRRRTGLRPFQKVVTKPAEQVHIMMGFESVDFQSPLRFESFVLNCILGGGMTSKLYQSVREKRGLVYNIYSSLNTFTDTGLLSIYAGTERQNVKDVLQITLSELEKIKKKGVTKKDLELYKTQVKGMILLGADDVDNRMNSLAVNEMVFGYYRPVQEIIDEVESVSYDSLHECLEGSLDLDEMGLLMVGNIDDIKF